MRTLILQSNILKNLIVEQKSWEYFRFPVSFVACQTTIN